ncbi:serine protease [Streptomyces sp. A0958]|uniref:serpin family protein n=1 Tax=Streptomyces sp. A0958 TaxID=2563101 RepID=UPI00109E7300|nr:serpin family protein [Streptomyces sp. A0958]THA63862.1 serine protease [Streptomyces sp. A0958]
MAQENGAGAVQRLGERWIRELARPGGGSFVCSPAGLWLALAALAAGARKETADELRAVLGVAEWEAARAATAAARELAATDGLGVATRVWTRTPVYRECREALPDIGFGPVDPDGIDAWVREATGGLIERLPLAVDDDMLLVLVNVLALTACWEEPFDPAETRERPFTDAAGVGRDVPTMHGTPAPWDVWMVRGAFVVELRCRTGRDGRTPARVRLVLGRPGEGAADVLPAAWAPAAARVSLDADAVTVAVPRLTLRTRILATAHLQALGIRLSTTPAADFSGLSPTPLMLSQVVQEAVVKVAEEGVEAAAVTVLPAPAGAAPAPPRRVLHLAFDRPFGIVVLDGGGEVPLFTAWQADIPAEE